MSQTFCLWSKYFAENTISSYYCNIKKVNLLNIKKLHTLELRSPLSKSPMPEDTFFWVA